MVEVRADCSTKYREMLNESLVQVGGCPLGLEPEEVPPEVHVQKDSGPSQVLDELSQKLIGLMK